MGYVLEVVVIGRDTGLQLEPPCCESCGVEMEFKDYHDWTVPGLEGESQLERAYYVCPECEGQTLFPLGPEAAAAAGSLELGDGSGSHALGVACALLPPGSEGAQRSGRWSDVGIEPTLAHAK
jgi:hypothetical protein